MATCFNRPRKPANYYSHNYLNKPETPTLFQSLISIGKLCDAGCEATFDKAEVKIIKDNKIILTGQRDLHSGPWTIPLTDAPTTSIPPPPSSLQCHDANQTNTIPELIQYLHATAFRPVASTWLNAIQKGFSQSWPGLTTLALRKYLPKSEATSMRHLDQIQRNLRSTKTQEDDKLEPT